VTEENHAAITEHINFVAFFPSSVYMK